MSDTKNALQEFFDLVSIEEKRVREVLKTNQLQGIMKAIEIWQNHFEQKYLHGINTVYDIARVNVIRREKGQDGLC